MLECVSFNLFTLLAINLSHSQLIVMTPSHWNPRIPWIWTWGSSRFKVTQMNSCCYRHLTLFHVALVIWTCKHEFPVAQLIHRMGAVAAGNGPHKYRLFYFCRISTHNSSPLCLLIFQNCCTGCIGEMIRCAFPRFLFIFFFSFHKLWTQNKGLFSL